MYCGANRIKNYVLRYVREDGGNRVETNLGSVFAHFTQCKENNHPLIAIIFDDVSLIYDMEDNKLKHPETDSFYMEYFTVFEIARGNYLLTGCFILINEHNEIFKEYRFVGEDDWLPPGTSYLPMPQY